MGMIFDEVARDLPLIRRIWSARSEITAEFTSVVKGSSMLCFTRYAGRTTVHLRGPETASATMISPEGGEYFGIDLRPGAYLPLFPPIGQLDRRDRLFPTLPGGRMLLAGQDWELPNEQNVDVFVDRLVRAGLLTYDPMVEAIRHGEQPRGMSQRTAQLRFRRAVGISRRKLASIDQAHHAAKLLAAGRPVAEAISEAGYYDQPQLVRAMRWATGHTPGELRSAPASWPSEPPRRGSGFRFDTRRSDRPAVCLRACAN